MKILLQGFFLLLATTLWAQLPDPPAALDYLKTVEREFQQAQEQIASQTRGETAQINQVRRDIWGFNNCDLWITDRQTYYTYNEEGQVAETISFIENGSIWVQNTRITNIYSEGFLVETTQDTWTGDFWLPATRTLYAFNEGRLSNYVNEVYVGSEWIGFIKSEFFYDVNQRHQETLISLGDPVGWVFWLRTENLLFNEFGQPEESLTEEYATEFDLWEPLQYANTQYDASGNKSYQLSLDWTGLDWQNSLETTFAYDFENRETLRLINSWSDLAEAFVPYRQYLSEYYPAENIDRFITMDAMTGDTGWVYVEQEVYLYQIVNNLEEIVATETKGTLTPNPATDFMQLTFESASKDAGQLLIYDNLGRLVSQQASQWTAGENQLEIQVQILGKGSYYLLLQGQQGRILTKSFQVH